MSDRKVTLEELKRTSPQNLAHCKGFVWHLNTSLGKGSFGEVFKGWSNDGNIEVAVKVVRKDHFRQDPKVRENLEREIRILKRLRSCEYVVHLYHVEELKTAIVLVMELCECDLDKLVEKKPFTADDTTLFLYQLAKGMKALRDHNIVHRDLKPGNILIKTHPHTGRKMIKLADFGFARYFKDEGMKPIDMFSLAGTPVFMAPEALRCVFHPGEHYDDKVDIWSIGSLLYKVIVGKCGFYAQLQDISHILKKKGQAIAFERVAGRKGDKYKINYIYDLPSSVDSRLNEAFREKMNNLLRRLLELDPQKRMTFTEFFEFVDDLLTSKIEVINLLHGSSFKIINDPNITVERLMSEIDGNSGVDPTDEIVFSSSSEHYISSLNTVSQDALLDLLDQSGGKDGKATLFLLPVSEIQRQDFSPDFTCVSKLIEVTDDEENCAALVLDHKYGDEIVREITYQIKQQIQQAQGIKAFYDFCKRELHRCQLKYGRVRDEAVQILAKCELALNWINADLQQMMSSSLSEEASSGLKATLHEINRQKDEINMMLTEMENIHRTCGDQVNKEFEVKLATGVLEAQAEATKRLTQRYLIHSQCKEILKACKEAITRVTEDIREVQREKYQSLWWVWGMMQKADEIKARCVALDKLLAEKVVEDRSTLLLSLATGGKIMDPKQKANAPFVLPPPTARRSSASESALVSSLSEEKQKLEQMFQEKQKEYQQLLKEFEDLRAKLQNPGDGVESTLVAANIKRSQQQNISPADELTLKTLSEKLEMFCAVVKKINPKLAVEFPTPDNKALYPDLADYSIINKPTDDENFPNGEGGGGGDLVDVAAMLAHAAQLMTSLSMTTPSLEATLVKGTTAHTPHPTPAPASPLQQLTNNTPGCALLKVANLDDYKRDDVVMFHPVKLHTSRASAPILLHVGRPKPYVFLDLSSYQSFGFRPGKIPDMVLAVLTEKPRPCKFEDHDSVAKDLGEKTGTFYYVKAQPAKLKFAKFRESGAFGKGKLRES